jgi:hypothetical protein
VREPRARRSPLEGSVSPRARRNPLKGGVSPRARRNPLEGALDWAALVGRGAPQRGPRRVCVLRLEVCFFLQVLS